MPPPVRSSIERRQEISESRWLSSILDNRSSLPWAVGREVVEAHVLHEIGHNHENNNNLLDKYTNTMKNFAINFHGLGTRYVKTKDQLDSVKRKILRSGDISKLSDKDALSIITRALTSPSQYGMKSNKEHYAETYSTWFGSNDVPMTPWTAYAGKKMGWTMTPRVKKYADENGINL
jgi:hypothetical protein